jgi:acyl carrier protein
MPVALQDIIAKIRAEVETLAGKPIPDLDTELFASGYLDSLNILHIIMFLESSFGLTIDPFAVNLEILGSINKIASFVQDQQGR